VWERLESLSDADNDSTHFEMHGMAECDHDMHNMTAWDKEDLTQQPDNRLHIVMMDCGDGDWDTLRQRLNTRHWINFRRLATCLVAMQLDPILAQHGILSNHTWWQPNYMATKIEAAIKERKHSIKAMNE